MARLMLSCGMFSALAAAIAPRRRGLPSGSPPPPFAAMVISLIRRVNILPRLASSAPFLCLIVAHFEWPDMGTSVSLEMPAQTRPPLRVYHRAHCVYPGPLPRFRRGFQARHSARSAALSKQISELSDFIASE